MFNKLILTAVTCCITLFASAQNTDDNFKPLAGDKTLEVGLNLNGGTFGQLKLRKFTTDALAFRYSTSVAYNYNKHSEDASSYTLGISFAPGIEKHFTGNKRLSPYLGVAIPLSINRSHYESDVLEIKGAASEYGSNGSYFSVGLNSLAGVDLYVVKNFYVGFEAGVGLSYLNYGEVEVNYKNDFPKNRTIEGYHGIGFNTFTTGGLRIGFVF